MAKPARTNPPADGSPDTGLLATKLHIPAPRPEFLARPRLLDRLEEGAARELTLVSAPAGFGKTSLLGEWARHSPTPVTWLSLDDGDNDPVRFWRHLAAALDRVHQGVGEPITALLRGPQPPLEAVTIAAVNELATRPGEAAVVVDDYHVISAPAVHHSMRLLLERLPAQLRLVVASRADPPLPLARLRARGQLAELRAAELRFTSEEAALLLGEVMGLKLPAGSVAALSARTEGWAAGLQLAVLSLRGHTDPAGFVASFSGSHRYVLDYLTEEVLDRQPEQVREFLLETSVLERLSGPLCDAVTGRSDSQRLLEQIERANLFLVPLDEVRGWWRYHHLFAALLRARLQQQRPDRAVELHRAAGAWHERHGLADDAIRHALAAGDSGWAARLVERHIEGLYRRSEAATMRRWFSALPAELIRTRPRLCVAVASQANIAGRLEEVEPLLADAERALAAGTEEPFAPSVGRQLSILTNVPAAIAAVHADRPPTRGPRPRDRVRQAGHGGPDRLRPGAATADPLEPRHGGPAARLPRQGGAAADQGRPRPPPAVGTPLVRPRSCPAGAGPSRRRAADLRPCGGGRQRGRPPAATGRPRPRGPGRGAPRTGRARRRPGARHQGGGPVPAAPLSNFSTARNSPRLPSWTRSERGSPVPR
jgi:LuxR family maltose regulon positive regulatory protein